MESYIHIELWCLTWYDLFLQEQNDQKEKEMSQLVKQMDQIKGEKDNLQSTLQQQGKETDNAKVCISVVWNQCCIFGVKTNLGVPSTGDVDPNDKADGDAATWSRRAERT